MFPDGVALAPPRQVLHPQRRFLVGEVEGIEWPAIDLVHGVGTAIAVAGITSNEAVFRQFATAFGGEMQSDRAEGARQQQVMRGNVVPAQPAEIALVTAISLERGDGGRIP